MRALRLRIALCGLATLLVARNLPAQEVKVSVDAAGLIVKVTDFAFIDGPPLQRLQDGNAVDYTFRLSVSNRRDGSSLRVEERQFVLSYDLWEERFAVTLLGARPRSVSNLTSADAQAWCLNHLVLPVDDIDPTRALWLRLEYHAEVPDPTSGREAKLGPILGGLIEIFSRSEEEVAFEGVLSTGPFRLDEVR